MNKLQKKRGHITPESTVVPLFNTIAFIIKFCLKVEIFLGVFV